MKDVGAGREEIHSHSRRWVIIYLKGPLGSNQLAIGIHEVSVPFLGINPQNPCIPSISLYLRH